jgi:hypothetical protein
MWGLIFVGPQYGISVCCYVFYELKVSQRMEGMEKNCGGSQGSQRAAMLEEEEEETEEANGITFNMRKSAKFCGL